jgi:hypothetical protein
MVGQKYADSLEEVQQREKKSSKLRTRFSQEEGNEEQCCRFEPLLQQQETNSRLQLTNEYDQFNL